MSASFNKSVLGFVLDAGHTMSQQLTIDNHLPTRHNVNTSKLNNSNKFVMKSSANLIKSSPILTVNLFKLL